MFRLVIVLLFLIKFSSALHCQTAPANPFDLLHRLPKISASGQLIPAGPTNPFDVVPHRSPGMAKSEFKKTPAQPGSGLFDFKLPKGKSTSKTFIFWTLVASFGFLTFSIASNRAVVSKSWRAFLSNNHLALAHREATGLLGNTPYFMLYASFIVNAGIFAFLITRFFQGDRFNNLTFLLLCVVGVGVIFALKHLLINFVSWLYPVGNEMRRYNFLITIFNCVLGLFLVPFNFLIAYAKGDIEPFLVFWTLGLIVVFYGYRSMRAAVIGGKILSQDLFHFLLYLCVAEIAPIVVLFKFAMLQSR